VIAANSFAVQQGKTLSMLLMYLYFPSFLYLLPTFWTIAAKIKRGFLQKYNKKPRKIEKRGAEK
jgi:hypothetical protein